MSLDAFPQIDYGAHPHYRQFAPTDELRRATLEKLEPMLKVKRAHVAATEEVYRNRPKDASGKLLGELARDGVSCMKLPASLMGRLRDKAAPLAAVLQERIEGSLAARKKVKAIHTVAYVMSREGPVSGVEDLAEVVQEALNESGILEASPQYFQGRKVAQTVVALKHNFAGHKIMLPKRRKPVKTGGLHIDSNSLPIMNGILYLSEVGPKNGPFEFVRGSQHWDYDIEDRAVRKAVDEIGVGGPNGEEAFLSLPKELQRKAAFGWDVEDGSDESDAMLRELRTHTSDTTDVVYFDADGAHRGGMVDQGHRLALLIHVLMR